MKSNEQLLDEIYSHFPEAENPDETMSLLLTDCFETGIDYWNTKWPEAVSDKEFYGDAIWDALKRGETFVYGDKDNQGELNLTNLSKALNTIKKHSPDIYEEITNEEWDADSCDAFFQVTVFGEVVFS